MCILHKENHAEGHYTKIDNDMISHPEMSCKAKGLLTFLLSKPAYWKVRVNHLTSVLVEGKDAIYGMLNELIRFGYVTRVLERTHDGRVTDVTYQVSEVPFCKASAQLPGNPETVNTPLIITELSKKEIINNCDFLNEDKKVFDAIPEVDLNEWEEGDIEGCDFLEDEALEAKAQDLPEETYPNAEVADEPASHDDSEVVAASDAASDYAQSETRIYPAKYRPASRSHVMLKHCIKTESMVENFLGGCLTTKQAIVVRDVAEYFAPRGGADELGAWIGNSLLNPVAFSNCQNFLHKMNAIIGKLRQGDYTRPFKLRYEAATVPVKRVVDDPMQKLRAELRTLEIRAFSYRSAISTCKAFPELAAMHQKSLAEAEAGIAALRSRLLQKNDERIAA